MRALTLLALCSLLFASAAFAQNLDARIRGGGLEGLLEIRPQGKIDAPWGLLCSDDFFDTTALIACRQAYGINTTRGERLVNYASNGGPMYYNYIYCPNPASRSLNECYISNNSNCLAQGLGVGVRCLVEAWESRLLDTASNRPATKGLVQVRPNSSAPWGYVCDSSAEATDALAICRSAGLVANAGSKTTTVAVAFRNRDHNFGSATGPAFIDSMICGLYDNLQNCSFSRQPTCLPNASLAVTCVNVTVEPNAVWQYQLNTTQVARGLSNRGVLTVRPSDQVPFGTVCANGFSSQAAIVACKSIGFPQANVTSSTWALSSQYPSVGFGSAGATYMSNIVCTGEELQLSECKYNINSYCTAVVVLDCNVWEGRLVGSGATVNSGRVEVRPNSTAPWGTVCAPGQVFRAADVACRQVASSGIYVESATVVSPAAFGDHSSTAPVYIGGSTSCSEGSKTFGGCAFTTGATCSSGNALAVSCGFAKDAPASQWQAAMAQQVLTLQTAPPNGTFGYVCRAGFGQKAADLMCRRLGFPNTTVGNVFFTGAPRYLYTRLIAGLNCPVTATDLAECSVVDAATAAPCERTETAGLECLLRIPPPSNFSTRILTAATPGLDKPYLIGLVQVKPEGFTEWGTVCGPSITTREALAFCRAAGYNTNRAVVINNAYASTYGTEHSFSMGPSLVNLVNCTEAGPTSGLRTWTQCSYQVGNGACAPAWNHPAVDCNADQWEARLLLQNGTSVNMTQTKNFSAFGRLEVRPNASAPWGMVCNSNFDYDDALRACAMLGWEFGASVAVIQSRPTSWMANESTHAYMNNVNCLASDTTLAECERSTDQCTTLDAVYLTCFPSNIAKWEYRMSAPIGNDPTFGRLEVRPGDSGDWGTVCDDDYDDTDAMVACQSVFPKRVVRKAWWYSAFTLPQYPYAVGQIFMDDTQCTSPKIPALEYCAYNPRHNCLHSEDVWIRCDLEPLWEARLVGGRNPLEGRLEGRPNSTMPFGTVCDERFDHIAAEAVCRTLGFSGPNFNYSFWPGSSSPYGAASGALPILATNMSCTTGKNMNACRFNETTGHCPHAQDVAVKCTPPTASGGIEFSLLGTSVNPDITNRGVLRMRPVGQAAWNVVCSTNFTQNTALGACVALGLATTTAAWYTRVTNGNYSTIGSSSDTTSARSAIWCDGSVSNIHECQYTLVNISCPAEDIVHLDCNTWEGRLVQGTTERNGTQRTMTGRAEVRSNNSAPWGVVCHDAVDTNTEAVAMCKLVGGDARLVVLSATVSNGSDFGPRAENMSAVIDELACSTISQTVTVPQCQFAAQPVCSSDLGLTCVYDATAISGVTRLTVVPMALLAALTILFLAV